MAGINYGFGGIAWHFEQTGTFALGFHHIGYGDFIAADESGLITGQFTAGESMIQLTNAGMPVQRAQRTDSECHRLGRMGQAGGTSFDQLDRTRSHDVACRIQ
jgi:hypothetical protein